MTIPDEMLMAYVDGELDDLARAGVERAAADDPEVARRLDEQRRLRERLAAHYAPVAEEEVPARFRALLARAPADLADARRRRRPSAWHLPAAIAASLVLGLFAGRMVLPPSGGDVAIAEGALVARGALAEALDSRLASEQPADSLVRIGISFVASDGRPCRTFEGPALAGLACRSAEDWRLVVTAPGSAAPGTQGYRQAASGSSLVYQTAQEMMAGEPFDAEAERRARDSGWRAGVD